MAQTEPLLAVLAALNEQIKEADGRLEQLVRADEVVRRLCSVPGAGPVVATAFASTLDGAARFHGARHARPYLGLVPREYGSGERQRRGRISKAGGARARALMVEAAWSLLRWETERTKALSGVLAGRVLEHGLRRGPAGDGAQLPRLNDSR